MMKRLLALSMAIATIGLASTATAQWAPAGPFTLSNVGNITVSKGITLTCDLSGAGVVDPSGTASVTSLSLDPGSFLCGLVSFAALPYNLTLPAPNTAVLEDVTVTAITGNCFGDLTGTCNAAGQIVFSGATIPSSPPGGSSCMITGTVATIPGLMGC